ncbi:MAG: MacB family efflux pump subunit [Xanthobacteraceae bacterium]|nr:MacB family efflux pump subunit [Xanthobacteraceae bacterium]
MTERDAAPPLIEIRNLVREYPSGEGKVLALAGVDLDIRRGEMLAIVGASGSGKSTLMNILGCLDRPSSGSYRVSGRETSDLTPDELAALRREHFGFIFQRYHLLGELTAAGNVEIPAIYAGVPVADRRKRAADLLGRLGLAERAGHRPNQLSGGQQQRVSIARALINGGELILADEPTGALDRASGEEVLRILDELRSEGRTIVIVTHDHAVAARADRIVEMSDGRIVSDGLTPGPRRAISPAATMPRPPVPRSGLSSWVDRLGESFRMALLAMAVHKMRTFLTMLGIIIGIASVADVVAIGNASQRKVLSDISSLGTNTIEVFPGKEAGDSRAAKITTLVAADAKALEGQFYVDGVTPTVSTSGTIRFGRLEANALVNGVGQDYFLVKGTKLAQGRLFDAAAVASRERQAVIDDTARATFFPDDANGGVGRIVWLNKLPCRVVGVIAKQQGGFGSSQNISVYLPYTTVQTRLTGDRSLRSLVIRVRDGILTATAERAVTKLLTQRHATKDFSILNTDDIRRTIESTTGTLKLLVAAIAVISLVVGGIGVMNIMLVSISERAGEIGVRMAVGARTSDVLQQFLVEAVLISAIGGLVGILFAVGTGIVFNLFVPSFPITYSATAILTAFTCSAGIGVAFGYLPARRAAALDPIVALARD